MGSGAAPWRPPEVRCWDERSLRLILVEGQKT